MALAAVLFAGCGREESPDLVAGKAQFVQKCGSCHTLKRAQTQGKTGPDLDAAFRAALATKGIDRKTVQGVVQDQIHNVRRNSVMPKNLVKGAVARDVAAYVAFATGKSGEDTGALASAGLGGRHQRQADLRGRRLRLVPRARRGGHQRQRRAKARRPEDRRRQVRKAAEAHAASSTSSSRSSSRRPSRSRASPRA